MGIINVNGIRVYAYHGCLPEEGIIGGEYVVDVRITGNFEKAEESDELAYTVDYCVVFETVKREMAIRSKLIEHVAKRIVDGLRKDYPSTDKFEVKVTKINPPMNGDVREVSFEISG